jgi:hypothetical protein
MRSAISPNDRKPPLTEHQAQQPRTALAREVQAAGQVGEAAVDAQQFIAARQPLSGRIDQHHDGPLRMFAGTAQHAG